MKAVLAMASAAAERVVGPSGLAEIGKVCQLLSEKPLTSFDSEEAQALLADTDILITGWGSPRIDEAALAAAPNLRAIIHTAGTVRGHVTDACFERGIMVSSAASANAVPVVEYTLAMILLEGKHVLPEAQQFTQLRHKVPLGDSDAHLGNYGITVGILSASLVGRGVMEHLRRFDYHVLLADPFVDEATAASYNAELVSNEELFARSDILSIHAPLLPATTGLVNRELIESMKPGASLINTARGKIVDHDAMTEAVLAGKLRVVLDVTDPEPLPADHPLWDSENAFLTPHLAGSHGNELGRMLQLAIDELTRFVAGEELAHPVRYETLGMTA